MHLDVLDLRNFYYRSALGRGAQKVIRDELTLIWPEAKGQTVGGCGRGLIRHLLGSGGRFRWGSWTDFCASTSL